MYAVRYYAAAAIAMMMAALPFVLLIAVFAVIAKPLHGAWWSITIVVVAYAHQLLSGPLMSVVHRWYGISSSPDAGAVTPPVSSRLTESQQEFLKSADDIKFSFRGVLYRLIFPTILLGILLSAQVMSGDLVTGLVAGVFGMVVAWFMTSLILMWPLQRQVFVERGYSTGRRLMSAVAFWTLCVVAWLGIVVVLLIFGLFWPLLVAVTWIVGVGGGVGLAVHRPPLVWRPAQVEAA
jgi:hypothetical protein